MNLEFLTRALQASALSTELIHQNGSEYRIRTDEIEVRLPSDYPYYMSKNPILGNSLILPGIGTRILLTDPTNTGFPKI